MNEPMPHGLMVHKEYERIEWLAPVGFKMDFVFMSSGFANGVPAATPGLFLSFISGPRGDK